MLRMGSRKSMNNGDNIFSLLSFLYLYGMTEDDSEFRISMNAA
jgi:hypothetical protein